MSAAGEIPKVEQQTIPASPEPIQIRRPKNRVNIIQIQN